MEKIVREKRANGEERQHRDSKEGREKGEPLPVCPSLLHLGLGFLSCSYGLVTYHFLLTARGSS